MQSKEFIPDIEFYLNLQKIHNIHRHNQGRRTPEQVVQQELLLAIDCRNNYSVMSDHDENNIPQDDYILRVSAEILRLGGTWEFEDNTIHAINADTGESFVPHTFRHVVASWPFVEQWKCIDSS